VCACVRAWCSTLQLYSLQLKPHQRWQVWPDEVSLLEFLAGGRAEAVIDVTVASLMTAVRSRVMDIQQTINDAHRDLSESMTNLRLALQAYNASAELSDAFLKYANYVHSNLSRVKIGMAQFNSLSLSLSLPPSNTTRRKLSYERLSACVRVHV